MSDVIRTVWKTVTWILIVLVAVLAVLLVGTRLVGLEIFTVLSSSMEPTYPVGSLVYVQKVDPTQLQVQDPVTYHLDDQNISTHRIVEITEENGQLAFITKGDANPERDAVPVVSSQVIGKPVFSIPKLGSLAAYIHSESGRYATIALGAVLLLLLILPDLIFKKEKKEKEEKDPEQEDEEPDQKSDEKSEEKAE